jgi:DNA-binding response OmpR family regulator
VNNSPEDEHASRDDAFVADLFARAEEQIMPGHPDFDPDEGLERFIGQLGNSQPTVPSHRSPRATAARRSEEVPGVDVEETLRKVGAADAPDEIRAGDLAIDEATYSARLRGRVLDLTFKEFELLKLLAEHPGRVFTRAYLLQEVWGYDYFGGTRTVDVHVRRLRAKLGPEHEALIGTVRNVGYRFVPVKGALNDQDGIDLLASDAVFPAER